MFSFLSDGTLYHGVNMLLSCSLTYVCLSDRMNDFISSEFSMSFLVVF